MGKESKVVGVIAPAQGSSFVQDPLPIKSVMQKRNKTIRDLKKKLERAHQMLREVVQYLNPEVSLTHEINEYLEEIKQ